MLPGHRNLITDVPGLSVGNAGDRRAATGVTVILPDAPAVAAVHVMGGAPGTRETDLLSPEQTVGAVDAVVLSGGSAYGLDAAGGVMAALRDAGRGFRVGDVRVPIVPAAILFDLLVGEKPWARPGGGTPPESRTGGGTPPYRDLGAAAVAAASADFALGSVGAGTGATTACGKGGLGSASTVLSSGVTVGALVAVNALGRVRIDDRHYWAAPFEIDGEFGGRGWPSPIPDGVADIVTKLSRDPRAGAAGANTTIAVVATDAVLTKAEAKRLAVAAHDGLARAIWPAHTPLDGDLVFALSTGRRPLADPTGDLLDICAVAASTLARAVARGVYAAAEAG